MTRTAELSELARAGFAELDLAARRLPELAERSACTEVELIDDLALAGDPDFALSTLLRLADLHPGPTAAVIRSAAARRRLILVLGASRGLASFIERDAAGLDTFLTGPPAIPDTAVATEVVRSEIAAASEVPEKLRRLRRGYRLVLLRVAEFDLASEHPAAIQPAVSAALTELAAMALQLTVEVATTQVQLSETETRDLRLAIVAMGKAGARELNYVSDVDIMFVAGTRNEAGLSSENAVSIATNIATAVMRLSEEYGPEPPLWQVDANLRPEGKTGALVRSLDSYLGYYERWAANWEFQALLKARPIAGDLELGAEFCQRVSPLVWASSARDDFVASARKMRERVTEHIPDDEVDWQLKLGPGGLRDIEFTVQLLELVHGARDESLRLRGTLEVISALVSGGYVGREAAAELDADYRFLRVLEHRLQLARLQRTHLMPQDLPSQTALARSARVPGGATALLAEWHRVKSNVRALHLRMFYQPLLGAVAAIPESDATLDAEHAAQRLTAIGFVDPVGALRHVAVTSGLSRTATIQRNLMPVLLQWLSEGPDPDAGLLAFRRLSDSLGASPWYLKLLRDSFVAAQRLMHALAGSRYVASLIQGIPEAVRWLDDNADLLPRRPDSLRDEVVAVLARHVNARAAARVLRTVRRREMLRLALASFFGLVDEVELGEALTQLTEIYLSSLLKAIRDENPSPTEFAAIAMGRFGSRELGLGSDVDMLYVFRAAGAQDAGEAHEFANYVAGALKELSEDPRLPFEIDLGLRPEGKNGAVVRSLESYREYYRRWSLTWEAQALLRAAPCAGHQTLLADFVRMADGIRYPETLGEHEVREVRHVKLRVERERLPREGGGDRNLKLGRGSLSDVEWAVQIIQLQYAARFPELRTTSTLRALAAAGAERLMTADDVVILEDDWRFLSRVRTAMTLVLERPGDSLPSGRQELDAIGRVVNFPPHSAAAFENYYLRVTRRARAAYERVFFGDSADRAPVPSPGRGPRGAA